MHGVVLSRTNCLSGRALVTAANLDGRPAHVDLSDIDLLSDLKDWKLQLSTEARKGGKEPRVDTKDFSNLSERGGRWCLARRGSETVP